ncbi:MAG: type II methionyl aminopeptidase [Thaumarchaeota archaeon]|nr:type II methionyl aminopeptidase [Nitrososphaerota archaeon]
MSTLSPEIRKEYVEAGRITREVRELVEARGDWRNKSYLELCNFVEENIRRLGGEPAFPTNVCADETAAHYTAEVEDPRIIEETTGLLKIDLGAHVNGFPADTSTTLCYDDSLLDLLAAVKAAQLEALKVIRAETKTNEVGRVVEALAERRGYVPISNLSGHSVDEFVVHAGTSIPNVWSHSDEKFVLGKVYATEQFFTTKEGSGIVVDGKSRNIFSISSRRRTGKPELDKFLDLVWSKRKTLPFALRWFSAEYSKQQLETMISQLLKVRAVHVYPELVEEHGTPIAQAENTVAITSAGPRILT